MYSAPIVSEAVPGPVAFSRVSAGARAGAIADPGDSHDAILSGFLRMLRRRDLGNHNARAHATNLAHSALAELRAGANLDPGASRRRSRLPQAWAGKMAAQPPPGAGILGVIYLMPTLAWRRQYFSWRMQMAKDSATPTCDMRCCVPRGTD